jgi:hypothetical protein
MGSCGIQGLNRNLFQICEEVEWQWPQPENKLFFTSCHKIRHWEVFGPRCMSFKVTNLHLHPEIK